MLKKILLLFIIISLAVAAVPVVENDLAERSNRQIQLTVDLDEVRGLALAESKTTEELLREYQQMGVTAVAIREASLARYRFEGKLSFMAGYDILANHKLHGKLHPDLLHLVNNEQIDSFYAYLFTTDRQLIRRLEKSISTKLNIPLQRYQGEELEILEVAIPVAGKELRDLASLQVGVMPADVELALKLGLAVVPRIDNRNLHTAEAVEMVLDELLTLPGANIFIFEGEQATGYPAFLGVTGRKLQETPLIMGVVEYTDRQLGQFQVAASSGVRTLLVHSTIFSQNPQAITNGVRQRRVRLIYLRLSDPTGMLWTPERARRLITGVHAELKRYGFEAGVAEPIAARERGRKFFAVLLLGLAAAVALLAERLFSFKDRFTGGVFVLAYLSMLALLALFPRDSALQLTAVLAGIVFPSLAVISQQLRNIPGGKGHPLWKTGAALAKTTLISTAGGVLILALMSNPFFAGGLSLYRGVKIIHTVPLLLIGLWALIAITYQQKNWTLAEAFQTLKRLWREPVIYGGLCLLGLMLLIAYFYVGRTGHQAGLYVPNLEIILRLFLDDLLLVRPRFKEFAVGFPLAWLGLYLVYRGNRSLLTAALITAGAIAQVSLINTFSHFSSPLTTSLLRTVNGFWLGSVLGLILILLFILLEKAYKHIKPALFPLEEQDN